MGRIFRLYAGFRGYNDPPETTMLQAESQIVESLQVLSNVLKRKAIYTYFSRSAMEKGLAYQAQGRVSAVKVSDDLTHVSAQACRHGSPVSSCRRLPFLARKSRKCHAA
ncbi:hypothetical protein ABIB73_000782 [Bradyrhizobium sp. F1.4.3]|uniref:hypothetical protein n=1 Tax=Bradyrhizobium sp. F1.4.3 TaxID=3156356 RepID=UPI00339578EC